MGSVAAAALAACTTDAPAHDRVQSGQASYDAMCKGCHGGLGEGGTGPSLRDWSRGEPELTSIIDTRMPLGNPDACRGDCAKDVAEYILATFKGAVQCSGPHLAARGLRLLTVREYKNTLADLVGASAQPPAPCGLHTFTFAQGSKTPAKVHVAGSFNGWPATLAAGGWAMVQANGTWSVQKQLAPGTYTYKLVLDESQWIADPGNPNGVPDGFGGQNSSLTIACDGGGTNVDVGANLPADTRPEGFLFDDNGPGRVVSSVHADEYLRSALLAAKAADLTKLVACDGKADPAGCAHTFVTSFGLRALRRPPTPAESARFEKLAGGADFDKGVRTAMAAMLLSPGFLYRSEVGEKQPDGTFRLTAWETASLLSYTFWGTMPDAALFDAAAKGELGTPAGLEAQTRRLLASPRARDQIGTFAEQWLGAENISTVDKSPALYPDFDAPMRAAMREETRRVVTRVFFDTKKFADLYTANWTVANDVLARQYGLAGVQGPEFRVVTYPDGLRAGVLGHGSILGATGLSDQTSPIRRGLMVRRRLLCQELPPPPPTAGGVPKVDPSATTRDRFAQHTSNPACHGCHQYIDGVGFGFERFDTVGKLRDQESGKAIDSAGDMNDVEGLGKGTHAPFANLAELGQTLASSDAAKSCLVAQYWRFARGAREPDSCSLAPIKARLVEKGGDLQEMMLAVVLASDFTVRR